MIQPDARMRHLISIVSSMDDDRPQSDPPRDLGREATDLGMTDAEAGAYIEAEHNAALADADRAEMI